MESTERKEVKNDSRTKTYVVNETVGQTEPEGVWEPKTFTERTAFLIEKTREYLDGKISWQEKWFYVRKYGPGAPGEKTI